MLDTKVLSVIHMLENGATYSLDNLDLSWTVGTIKVDRHSASWAPEFHSL